MTAFNKVLKIIENSPQYGHDLINAQNRINLIDDKEDIEEMLK